MQLHPDLGDLVGLVGQWSGEGRGAYPGVEPFCYREETSFSCDGRPILFYQQRTWVLVDGREAPAHGEAGFLVVFSDRHLEATIAQTGGMSEVALGRFGAGWMELRSATVGRAPGTKEVHGLWRRFELAHDTLHAQVEMTAMGHRRQWHLTCTLRRS